ncbi:hypothetical protein KQX54_005277 [Cotesia glomerata]|uniref:Uncharacterized protein n=1 Tax=Cotesia glomerata TaxID=32391 RepID=A0AAV7IPV1_COTGL|nr:hypothetical protein KQX54_005277 [Cotesia glomerata]
MWVEKCVKALGSHAYTHVEGTGKKSGAAKSHAQHELRTVATNACAARDIKKQRRLCSETRARQSRMIKSAVLCSERARLELQRISISNRIPCDVPAVKGQGEDLARVLDPRDKDKDN